MKPSEKALIFGVEVHGFRRAIRLTWTVLQSPFSFHGSIRIRDVIGSPPAELIQAGSRAPRGRSQFSFHYVTPKPMIVLAISAAGRLFEMYGCP